MLGSIGWMHWMLSRAHHQEFPFKIVAAPAVERHVSSERVEPAVAFLCQWHGCGTTALFVMVDPGELICR